ncbi:hypothetical protein DUNSADRAFT_14168 [Dunaliella salina]|uniref:Uncharacterized protein n=1 Tax=Dunaliella salina TaxID=3046 RepID=A0ABQ7H2T2_DUNSA|nr:hypothetical protein DUNSADRAFT_14168 [Dunaliella salina]|eukprot:KAF5841166.1 hypothetical protein DUNSADRAFT_14168 [Dunaliella salina]
MLSGCPSMACMRSEYPDTWKLSKHKSYNVAQVLLATPSYNPEQAAKDVQERLANRPTSMVAAAKARLEASQARLQALRDMYAKELSKVSRVSRGSSSSSSSSSSSDNTGKGGDGSNDHTVEDETQGSSRSGESSADQGSQGDASSSHSDSSSNGSSMQDASTSSTPRSPSGSPFESTVPGAGPPGVRTACTLAHGAHQHPSCLTPPPASSAATYLLHTPFMPRGLAFQWKPVTTFVSGFVGRWSAPLWEGCSS